MVQSSVPEHHNEMKALDTAHSTMNNGIRRTVKFFIFLRYLLAGTVCARDMRGYDYEGCRLWPAAMTEKYSNPNQIARTVVADEFEFVLDKIHNDKIHGILQHAEKRFLASLRANIPAHDSPYVYPVNPHQKSLWPLKGVEIAISYQNQTIIEHGMDESYELEIRPVLDNKPLVLLKAKTFVGAMWGIQSFLQLVDFGWFLEGQKPVFTIENSPLYIHDRPTYPYRGLLIDTSRHYLPMDLILRNLNAMEANKLNVLHWHIVDSQSWPYQSLAYPELSRRGAYCHDCIYTVQDIVKVVQEAALRGIRVIPEFDVPGHTASIGKSHPELLSYCDGRYQEPLNVTRPQTYDFLRTLYDEVMSLFPDSWIHVGGDEVDTTCWEQSPEIQQWMKQHNLSHSFQLQEYFEDCLFSYLVGKRTPIAWQEVMEQDIPFQRQFPFGRYSNSSIVIDVWKMWLDRRPFLLKASQYGYRIMASSCWYLDHLDKDFEFFYSCQPWDFVEIASDLQKSLVGGHGSMWGEQVDANNFFPRVWPRLSAVAEQVSDEKLVLLGESRLHP